MRNELRNHGSGVGAWVPAIIGDAQLATAREDDSASGAYVSHAAYETTLLQITETPDHRFTGTLSHASLNKDGTLWSRTADLSGSVEQAHTRPTTIWQAADTLP